MAKVNQQSTEGTKPANAGDGSGAKGSSGGSVIKGGVVPLLLPGACMAEDCKGKSQKAGFCFEHFDWFKEGLITKEGRKPSDFDKKYFDYHRKLQKKAA